MNISIDKVQNAAQAEYLEIIKTANKKESERVRMLKESGQWIGGLDGNNMHFQDIKEERDREIKKLAEKYSLLI